MSQTFYAALVLAGGASYGIISTLVKLSYRSGFSINDVSSIQYFLGFFLLWTIWLLRVRRFPAKKTALAFLLTGIPLSGTTMLYNHALETLPASHPPPSPFHRDRPRRHCTGCGRDRKRCRLSPLRRHALGICCRDFLHHRPSLHEPHRTRHPSHHQKCPHGKRRARDGSPLSAARPTGIARAFCLYPSLRNSPHPLRCLPPAAPL